MHVQYYNTTIHVCVGYSGVEDFVMACCDDDGGGW